MTIHRGTAQDTGVTRIGNDNLLMINAHVAHDCVIGNHCIIANNGTLAGHVTLDDYVIWVVYRLFISSAVSVPT